MANGTVVLVHGAWTGSWIWRQVTPILRANGLNVSTVTLTGSGERRHSATPSTGLQTHVDDVISHIEMEDLNDVTLVGWSYGGMVITGAADAIPNRIAQLTYLDAFVPEDGMSLVDYLSSQNRVVHESWAAKDQAIPPLPLDIFEISNREAVEFITPRLTHQPWRTFFEPSKLVGETLAIPKAYILCTGSTRSHFEGTYTRMCEAENTRTSTFSGDHFCPMSAPLGTAVAILESLPPPTRLTSSVCSTFNCRA
ncbi:alpha/beta fold hydrolase [Paraburkholderia caribensis]